MQSDRRQTLQDVSNVPRRLTMGDNLGKVGRRPSIAVAPPTARKAHGAERASGNGSASQAQDPRNIHRNANVQRRLRQRIIDFASQNNFSEPLDDKKLQAVQVSQKLWEALILFLIGKIDTCRSRYGTPGNRMDKIEAEVELFLKFVQYPPDLRPTQAAMFTPGNVNIWHKLLGVLDWLVCYLEYRNKVSQLPTGWHTGHSGVFTRWAGKCHAAFLSSNDAEVERLTEEMRREVLEPAGKLQLELGAAQEEARELQVLADQQAELAPKLAAARNTLHVAQQDAQRLEEVTQHRKAQQLEMIAVTRGAGEALAADKIRVAQQREAVRVTREAIKAQPLTLEQAKAMMAERAEQQRRLKVSQQATRDKAAAAAQAADSLLRALDHVDARVQIHNARVDDLRLDADMSSAAESLSRLSGTKWHAFLWRDAAETSAMLPADNQAVRTALVALQRHHRDRQAEMLNKQYSYESALKDGARSAQEVSEEILQQQHKAAQIDRRLAEAMARQAQEIAKLDGTAEALRQQEVIKQSVLQGGGEDGAHSNIDAATRVLVDMQAQHDDEWRLQTEALFQAADVLQRHKDGVRDILRRGRHDVEATGRRLAAKPQLTQLSVLSAI